jgi:hypothetical protein
MPLTYTQQARLALLAALGGDPPDANAFDLWQASVDIEDLPPGHFLLLPLIYDNLEQSGRPHPWLPRIRGVYRKMWYASQVALRAALAVVEAVQAAGQPALIAGAAALAHTVYPQPELRPLLQPEVIVPVAAADAALQALHALGWRAQPAAPHLTSPAFRAWVAGQRFVNDQGQALWLGWHVVPTLPCADLDAACWAAAAELTLDGRAVRTLCPADHLLRTCLTAPEGGLIALADAALLVRSAALDWQRFLELAGRFRAGRPARHVLETLAETVGLAAPPEVRAALHRQPDSWAERRIPTGLAGLAQPAARRLRFWRLLARYQRTVACAGRPADPRNFIVYLQHTRHLDSPWRLPLLVLRRMVGR